ncbi:MAG: UDP-glucose 4-epimerase GalE [Clostridiaceae bacterium]|jgi:UDP-glucose 4-epimerase|nr:UDP-glucose 4-epimerase GalE [Clostridiaceae bacterium]
MAILVTGGAGFIGSHTCVELLNAGYDIVVVDNYYNSSPKSLDRVRELTGKDFKQYECDIRDSEGMDKIFKENKIDAVIHFAGLKAVGESCRKPMEYYDNNIGGTVKLCQVMRDNGCKNIVFSSSATVYGMNNVSPLKETMKAGGTTNPYGTTKYMIEIILEDICKADEEWNATLLRYFNPIGAHKSGRIGENPNGIPNNLMPYITQVAIGRLPCLSVFGNDYDTPDGTGVRDYIHVVDLADGHVKAVKNILEGKKGVQIFNLGTGKGYSVLDIINGFEKATGVKINYKIVDRRPGDIATCYSDPSKAKEVLGWEAKRDIEEMCEDSWRWQSQNPNGFED